MFEAASSEVRQTHENVRVFRDTLRDLGRNMSDIDRCAPNRP